jgi:hypothetical protein
MTLAIRKDWLAAKQGPGTPGARMWVLPAAGLLMLPVATFNPDIRTYALMTGVMALVMALLHWMMVARFRRHWQARQRDDLGDGQT